MPESIPYPELRQSQFAELVFLRALCQHQRDTGTDSTKLQTPGQPLSISLSFNGVELPFVETLSNVYGIIEELAEERAKEMVEELAGPVRERLEKVDSAITELLRNSFPFFKESEDD